MFIMHNSWSFFILSLHSYWPVIDDELRKAAFDRGVQVRLMASLWNHTRSDMKLYLKSLAVLNTANKASIEVVGPVALPSYLVFMTEIFDRCDIFHLFFFFHGRESTANFTWGCLLASLEEILSYTGPSCFKPHSYSLLYWVKTFLPSHLWIRDWFSSCWHCNG